jgi:hypothetical protein
MGWDIDFGQGRKVSRAQGIEDTLSGWWKQRIWIYFGEKLLHFLTGELERVIQSRKRERETERKWHEVMGLYEEDLLNALEEFRLFDIVEKLVQLFSDLFDQGVIHHR